MGQLIDFSGKVLKKPKPPLQDSDVISLLPRLRNLKGEIIVVSISSKVLQDDELLAKLLREVITIKCMGAIVLIIPDINDKINVFCEEAFNIPSQLDISNFVNTSNQVDILDVICKREVINKILNILKSFNSMALGLSGHNLEIVFPDDVVNQNQFSFEKPARQIYNGMSEKKNKKYSIDMLEELLKTDIIPVIWSTFKIKNGNVYTIESNLFGSYISTYLSSLKYVEVYADEQTIPTSSIYGIEKFSKILKTGSFDKSALKIINAGIEAVKNGVQGAHILNIKQASLLEEFCNKSFSGLFLYDDTLNQL